MREKLTPKDVEKIEQEIEHRKLVIRREAIEAVKEARAQGDLSENFEYYAAKKHKNQNESRIRYLERMLKTADIVTDTSKEDEIGMDDIVEVEFEEDGERETYKLVTSIRGNSLENRVSIESPIGKALKGRKVGTECGSVSMRITVIILSSALLTRAEQRRKTSAAFDPEIPVRYMIMGAAVRQTECYVFVKMGKACKICFFHFLHKFNIALKRILHNCFKIRIY